MAGFQISILNITNHKHWLAYLDTSTDAPVWNGTCQSIPLANPEMLVKIKDEPDKINYKVVLHFYIIVMYRLNMLL